MSAPEELKNAISASPMRAGLPLSAGTVIDERYEITGFLGEGGMCQVFKAEHLSLRRTAAVKLLKPKLLGSQISIARFMQEAKALSELKHPNIVEIFSVGSYGQSPYVALEYLDGISLAELLDQQADRKLPLNRSIAIFVQICDALAYTHSKGVIHRDLKPSNVIVLARDQIKLVDFGIAKLLDTGDMPSQKLTQSGSVIGTPQYMSPEQCLGASVDARSDIYSLGCLMHEVLTGEPPFTAENSFALLSKHVNKTVPIGLSGGDPILRTIAQTLAKDPNKRPQSAAELKDLLLHGPKRPSIDRRYVIALSFAIAIVVSGIVISRGFGSSPEPTGQQSEPELAVGSGPANYAYRDSIDHAKLSIKEHRWVQAQRELGQAYQLAIKDPSKREDSLCEVKSYWARLLLYSHSRDKFPLAINLDRSVIHARVNSDAANESKMTAYKDLTALLNYPETRSESLAVAREFLDFANVHGRAQDRFNATWVLGESLLESNKYNEAVVYLTQAEAKAKGSEKSSICITLGQCYTGLMITGSVTHAAENGAAATKWYQRAIEFGTDAQVAQSKTELAGLAKDRDKFRRGLAAHRSAQPPP